MNTKRRIKMLLIVIVIAAAVYVVFMTDIAKVHTGIAALAKRYLESQQKEYDDLTQGEDEVMSESDESTGDSH